MPGSPPIRTVEPATRPPPSTRSSSAIAVDRRAGPEVLPASPTSSSGLAAPARMPLGTAAGALSSASVFHSAQASQRPAHLTCTAPQL